MFDPYPLELERCTRCPRLVRHREEVARTKRRSYREHSYWGRPVPGFGDPEAEILLLGLAPGAHGSNRTGRMFTGDGSGDFLFPALYRAGLANQPESAGRRDGLELHNLWITAAARCAPPGNRPTRGEVANCRGWLGHDVGGLPHLKLVLALGVVAHDSYLELLKAQGHTVIKNRYPFAHGALHTFDTSDTLSDTLKDALPLLDSYHVSFQNTNTGKLTPEMFDRVLEKAKSLVGF